MNTCCLEYTMQVFLYKISLQVGDRIVVDNCTQECHCRTTGGDLVCEPMVCPQNSTCSIERGVMDCYCADGLRMNQQFQCEGMFV